MQGAVGGAGILEFTNSTAKQQLDLLLDRYSLGKLKSRNADGNLMTGLTCDHHGSFLKIPSRTAKPTEESSATAGTFVLYISQTPKFMCFSYHHYIAIYTIHGFQKYSIPFLNFCLCSRVKPEPENMVVFVHIFIYQFPNRKFLKYMNWDKLQISVLLLQP